MIRLCLCDKNLYLYLYLHPSYSQNWLVCMKVLEHHSVYMAMSHRCSSGSYLYSLPLCEASLSVWHMHLHSYSYFFVLLFYICTHRLWILMMHQHLCLCPAVTPPSFIRVTRYPSLAMQSLFHSFVFLVTQAFLYQIGYPPISCYAITVVTHTRRHNLPHRQKTMCWYQKVWVFPKYLCFETVNLLHEEAPSKFCNVLLNYPLPLVDFTELFKVHLLSFSMVSCQTISNIISNLTNTLYLYF